MTKITPIELLSPAKNAEIGIVAIDHGADAVYIGAPQFSARAMAGNSISEIERLSQYAHRFGAKVFVALNTILTDDELPQAEKMTWQLYEAGADALIVQDMGLLQVNLPPIRLHASTQCDNRDIEKIHLLQNAGFKRVVLARELTLTQIADIRAHTTVELEAFVHGAVCVSYSGQCYLSQALCGRSANRGACAQMCRLPYNLLDDAGNTLLTQKHLLSLKDMNRADYLLDLLKVGITTLKIEGRLKDADYVKNVVSYYRKKLDVIFESNHQFSAASWGKTTFFFTPNPEKTFHRGNSDYFLHGRQTAMAQFDTPKSIGEYIGQVTRIESKSLIIDTNKPLSNGDGFCSGNDGFMANRVEVISPNKTRIFPAQMPKIEVGSKLFRNFDIVYDKILKHKTAERQLSVQLVFLETENGFQLNATQPDSGCQASIACMTEKIPAQKAEQARQNIRMQLGKLGNSIFYAESIDLRLTNAWFLPTKHLNEWRRQVIEQLEMQLSKKTSQCIKNEIVTIKETSKISSIIDYRWNVHNRLAENFYKQQGATQVAPSFEKKQPLQANLMTCKYCLKYELGWCYKQKPSTKVPDQLYLQTNKCLLHLHFDCGKCEMRITHEK